MRIIINLLISLQNNYEFYTVPDLHYPISGHRKREECSQREMTHSCLWLKLMRYLSGNVLVSGFSLYFQSGQQHGKHCRDSGVLTVVAAGTGGSALVSAESEE